MNDNNFTQYDSELAHVLRRIECLKSSESISLEEKIKIAELVLSIIEEEKAREIVQ